MYRHAGGGNANPTIGHGGGATGEESSRAPAASGEQHASGAQRHRQGAQATTVQEALKLEDDRDVLQIVCLKDAMGLAAKALT